MQVNEVAKNLENILEHALEHVKAVMGDYYNETENYVALQETAQSLDKATIQMRRVQFLLGKVGLNAGGTTSVITKLVDLLPVELVEQLLQDLLAEMDTESLFWDALYEEYEAAYPERSTIFQLKGMNELT